MLLRTCEAAKILGLNKKTLLGYCHQRLISYILYPDGSFRFRRETLNQWLSQRTVKGRAA